jgi:GDPmannose 4,6-dehydratase
MRGEDFKTAVVTGATGQDGALLSKFLLEKDYRVVGMVRRTSSSTDWRLKELGLIDHPNLHLCSGDLQDQGSIERILKDHQPEEVYNLAAQSHVGASWDLAASTFATTAQGAVHVFDAVRNVCPEARVYQASSSEMFGGAHRTEWLNENSTFDPQSPYGVAKVAAHQMAKVYSNSFGMFIACGILFNHESEYRGEEFVTRKVTKSVAEIVMADRKYITLGNLDSVRDWGYAPDYVEAMWMMLQRDEPEDFVIATGITRSIDDLCCAAFAAADISDWRHYVQTGHDRPADVKHLRGNPARAHDKLGWEPRTSFVDMIKKMVEKDIVRLTN